MFPVTGFLKRYLKNQTRPVYTSESVAKPSPKQKVFIVKESPFCAEQNGKIRFCVVCFVYKIRGIKRMQKPL